MKNYLNATRQRYSLDCLTFSLLFLLFACPAAHAQIELTRNPDITVTEVGDALQYPWTGGLNAPQFTQVDLNFDGLPDIFVFDRYSDLTLVFFKTEDGYVHDIGYSKNFPPMESWALLRDYNCDGIPDLFTSKVPNDFEGIAIYEGTRVGNHLEFSLITEQITFDGDNPLVVSVYDLPDINDIDGDGDLDILTFQTPSGGFIEYFENITSNCDKGMTFSRVDECWGKIYESGISTTIKLDTICEGGGDLLSNSPIDRHSERHPGSTLLSYDENNDGAREMVLGDISFDNLVKLNNGGSNVEAFMVDQDTLFPVNNIQAVLQSFPAAYSVDVNFDGLLDMIVSPNSGAQLETRDNVWYYQNVGSNSQAVFERQTSRWLVDQTIDVGRFAQPALADVDGDGLQDLIVGHYTKSSGSIEASGLYFYKNTGTSTSPAFSLETDDFLGLRGTLGLPALFAPAFGDIDSDGDIDMMLGIGDTDYNGQLILFENDAEPGAAPNFVYTPFNIKYADIDVGQFSIPQLIDADRDGLTDILVGSKNQGRLFFYKNIGEVGAPAFGEGTNYWGEVILVADGFPEGHSAPVLTDINGDGNYHLIVGTREGPLYVFDGIENNVDGGAFDLVGSKDLQLGQRTVPCIGELDGDPQPEMIVGTERGGLVYYNIEAVWPTALTQSKDEYQVQLYPNPADQLLHIQLPENSDETSLVTIFNIKGQIVHESSILRSKMLEIQTQDWPSGLYQIEVKSKAQSQSLKLMIQHQ